MDKESIRDLIYQSSVSMDAEDFEGFMALCDPQAFTYRIVAFSPEIGQEMVWLDHDFEGMKVLFKRLPDHVRIQGRFMRHVNVYSMEEIEAGLIKVSSKVLLAHTDHHGSSTLFATGRYTDLVATKASQPRLSAREVRLDTRDLGPGMHIPV